MASRHKTPATSETSKHNGEPVAYAHRFVEANGLKLHYLDYGTEGRRPMLCVHGGGAHAHWFDFVAPGFNKNYHVRALDLRGHGESQWADPPVYSFENFWRSRSLRDE